jgi:hypothetical protein
MNSSEHTNILLHPGRLDVFTKTPLVRSMLRGTGREFAFLLYRSYLFASNGRGNFREGSKRTIFDYEVAFFDLVHSMQAQGYMGAPIKHSRHGIIDGAHRAAACLTLGIEPVLIESDEEPHNYDYQFMRRIGLDEFLIEATVREYLEHDSRVRGFLLTDFDEGEVEKFTRILGNTHQVLFHTSWVMSDIGVRRVLELAYGHLEWWSHSSYETTVAERFRPNAHEFRVALVLFLHSGADEELLQTKTNMRQRFNFKNFDRNIHGTDNFFELRRLADPLLNENARFFMNNVPIGKEDWIAEHLGTSVGDHNFAIRGSSILALYTDYLPSDVDKLIVQSNRQGGRVDEHELSYASAPFSASDVLADPRRSFKYKDFSFISLSTWAGHRLSNPEPKMFPQLSALSRAVIARPGNPIYNRTEARIRARKYSAVKAIADKAQFMSRFLPLPMLKFARRMLRKLLS